MDFKRIAMYKLLIVSLFAIVTAGHGQTVNGTPNSDEIWRQKKTQRKYLTKQIALLQAYTEFLKKGYEVAQKGLNLIGAIKDGDFQQHKNYFASLKAVKPAIRDYSRVQLIASQLDNVQVVVDKILNGPYHEEFTGEEWQEVIQACSLIHGESTSVRDDLALVLTSNELQMTDDQRLQRIDYLNEEMSSVCSGARELLSSIESLWRVRAKARQDGRLLLNLNEQGS